MLSTRAMKKLSEKQKLIQEQSRVIVEKEKERKENMAAVKERELISPQIPPAFSPSLHELTLPPQAFLQIP